MSDVIKGHEWPSSHHGVVPEVEMQAVATRW